MQERKDGEIMQYYNNLAYKYDACNYEEQNKNNIIPFARLDGYAIVEANQKEKNMVNVKNVLNVVGNKAVILVRVSSREQEEGYSIEAQLTRLHKYCERRGLEIIKEFIIVESSTRGERENFYEMIAYIKR